MNKYLYILLLSMLAAEAEAQQVAQTKSLGNEHPRLVVNIIIDQLRSDYMEEFMPYYCESGLKKLLTKGLVYTNARYPFASTDRASAVASVNTGSYPYINGIPANEWLSQATLRPLKCYTDSKLTGANQQVAQPTPANLRVSTISDELKIATKGGAKIYSIAAECDAAVMSAGHNADGAFWIDKNGEWTTSSYYMPKPVKWLTSFNKLNSPSKSVKGEFPINYSKTADVNIDITNMALHCIASDGIGVDAVTDMLCLEYYAGPTNNTVGTNAASSTKSINDIRATYTKLDQAIGRLLSFIEKRFGLDKVLFTVTSTGYSVDEISDYSTYKVPSGTVYVNRSAKYLNMFLGATYGQGQYVEGYYDNNIYLNHKVLEQKRLDVSDVLKKSREMLLLSDGISEVYTRNSLLNASNDEERAVKNGYTIGVSGDIIIEQAPGWRLMNEDTQRYRPCQMVCPLFPVIIYGSGNKTEKVEKEVSTAQIAPTICKSIRIRAPNACKSAPLY